MTCIPTDSHPTHSSARLFARLAPALIAAALTLSLSCSDRPEPSSETESEPAATADAETVRQEIGEAAAAIESYAFGQKEQFEQWGEGRLAELDRQIDALRTQSEELTGDAREEWRQTLSELDDRRLELRERFDAALDSSADSWEELESGFSAAQKQLADALERAAEEFDEPAPHTEENQEDPDAS